MDILEPQGEFSTRAVWRGEKRGHSGVEGVVIGQDEIRGAMETLRKYKDGKARLESRIVENEKWYRMRHWDAIGRPEGQPAPTSAWLFNSLANKHADMMDNYPAPNVLPRERGDEADAESLSAILPVVLERNDYEGVYSDASWYKLKNGTSAYGVFWDKGLENGLGDIAIRKLDLLNLFWEPGVREVQDSRNLFIVSLVDNEVLRENWPEAADKLTSNRPVDVKQYVFDDAVDTSDKALVVDWYYKRVGAGGGTIVHLCKFCGDTLLFASENDPAYQERGFYDHGKYPVVFDVLFPIEGQAAGFGYIDVMRDPQLYIDKLDADILANAELAGKPRWFIKDTGGVNENEFGDFSKRFVHVAGGLDEDHLRQIKVDPLANYIIQHRQAKIDELKETSGNRDVNAGGTSGGATAASAIAALQEAGNKLSRDALKASYRAFTQMCNLSIELIRQFYDEERCFRIEGEDGRTRYVEYSNAGIRDQALPPAYPGQESEPGYRQAYRRPVFDISVKAQRSNPFNRVSQNELAKELYAAGFFDPSRADMALAALDLMDFEGKSKTVQTISQNKTLYDIVMQQQAVIAQMQSALGMPTEVSPGGTDAGGTSAGSGTAVKVSGGGYDPNERAAANAAGAQQQRIAATAPA